MSTPNPPQEKKGRFSFPGFSSFKRAKKEKSSALQQAKDVLQKIESMPPLIKDANNKQTIELDKAKRKYKEMSESSVKNIYAAKLSRKIQQTNENMQWEIAKFNKMNTEGKSSQEIYRQWRKIEQQAETLKYLTQIAKLKLHSSANVIQQSNSMGVTRLRKLLPTVLENFKEFEAARTKVSEYLKLSDTPKPHQQ
jgi:hypothetical protein